eukprot:685451-Rhodomonas_salina.1
MRLAGVRSQYESRQPGAPATSIAKRTLPVPDLCASPACEAVNQTAPHSAHAGCLTIDGSAQSFSRQRLPPVTLLAPLCPMMAS